MATFSNQDQKNNATQKSSNRDFSSIILDYKNFDEAFPRLKEALSLEYDLAGRILIENKECPPSLPPRTQVPFADPQHPTDEERLFEEDQLALRSSLISLTAKDTMRYNSQKLQIATRLLMQCSKYLRTMVEKNSRFASVEKDPLLLSALIEDTVYLGGETFNFRDHVKQFMVLANPKNAMSEKSNLSQYTKRYTTEYEKLHSMLVKLKLDNKSNPTMTIEEYVEKLVAAFFIEQLPKSFDEVRKDISNEKVTSVQQPENLQEAAKLADQYDNIKSSSFLSAPDRSPNNNLVAPVTDPRGPKPPRGSNNPKIKEDGPPKKERFTDPNKPPPNPWKNMVYCTHCKFWCSHTVEQCKTKKAADKKKPNKPNKPAKVGSAVTYDDDDNTSVWGMSVKA